jgi:hypothetical protein
VQAQLAERDSLRKAELAESRALVRLTTGAPKGTTVSLIKAQIDVEPDILDLRDKYEEKYAYRKILEMMLNNQERDITLVSREISRRSQTMGRRDSFTL